MATNFLLAPGTNGFITTPFNLLSTELNALASGAAATSSVGGTSGVFNETTLAQALALSVYFTSGGTFTPSVGGIIALWFLLSPDGGSTFETAVATPSTTVMALSRSPDAIISLDNAAFASGNIRWANGLHVPSPWESFKVLAQNLTGGALPATGNLIKAGPVTPQY